MGSLAACGGTAVEHSVTAPLTESRTTLSFAGRAPGASFAAPAHDIEQTVRVGNHVLVIKSAKVVMHEAILSGGTAQCEYVSCGALLDLPVVIDLPLGDGAMQHARLELPAGVYGGVALSLYRLPAGGGSASDAQIRAEHPEMAGRAVLVTGTFDGVAFEFTSEDALAKTIALSRPVMVVGGASTNITVRLAIADWFRNADGSLIDPRTAQSGGVNASAVAGNMARGVMAFEDRNHDGDDRNG